MSALGDKIRQHKSESSARLDALAGEADNLGPGSPPVFVPPGPGVTPPPGPGATPPPFAGKLMRLDWNHPERLYTRDVGGFGANDIIAIEFTTGNLSSSNNLPHITAVEYQGPPQTRHACLADQPGVFDEQATLDGKPVPDLARTTGVSVTFAWAQGETLMTWGYPLLKLNHKYYVNIRNEGPVDPEALYNMSIELAKSNL